MKKNYFVPQTEAMFLESAALMLDASPVDPSGVTLSIGTVVEGTAGNVVIGN